MNPQSIPLPGGKAIALNVMDMGSDAELIELFSKMAETPLTPEQKTVCSAVIKALPSGSTLKDFLDACNADAAKRLGISTEALTALTPLFAALETYIKPGMYGHLFTDEYHLSIRTERLTRD